jgi:hypothetical protein
MKEEDIYRKVILEAGLEPQWVYHKAFRDSYSIYLQGLVPKILDEIEFNRVVCVFLDTFTWKEINNHVMPLPYQLTRHISDFAEMLWAGLDSMEDVVNNVECFMQLMNYTVPKTGEHVPIILFNLFPTEGNVVSEKQAENIANALVLGRYENDYWLEDLNADLEFLNPYIGKAEKLVLFGVPEEHFNTFRNAVVGLGKLPFLPINRFEVMNCGGRENIDSQLVTTFLQSLGKNQSYAQKDFWELLSNFKKGS